MKKRRSRFLVFSFLFVAIVACNNESEISVKYQYRPNGNIKTKTVFVNGTKQYYYHYDMNNFIAQKKMYKNDSLMYEVEYKKNGDSTIIYAILKDTIDIANTWLYYHKGEIVKDSSCYILMEAENDTINYGEEYVMKIGLEAPTVPGYCWSFVAIANLDEQYHIIDTTKIDTLNGWVYPEIGIIQEYRTKEYKIGINKIEGYITEQKIYEKGDGYVRKIYFNKKFYVLK